MTYYNPEDYETTHERLARFFEMYPDGRITTELVSAPDNFDICRYKASIYRRQGDEVSAATGYACEKRDPELTKSKSGQEYASVNYDSWEENCETSAIGRALANLGLSGAKRPTREEMTKAARRPTAPAATPLVPEKPSSNGNGNKTTPVQEAPPAEPPTSGTDQKVQTVLKRIQEAENPAVLKQIAREVQFLNPRLTQPQKVALKDAYFTRKQQIEDQPAVTTS